MPDYLAELFQAAARNSATLAAALNARPLPEGHINATGTDLRVPAMSSGAAVGIQSSENTSTGIGATDPVFTLSTAPIGYAAGVVNLSRQLLDRARPDDFLASELGRAAGERIDIQLVTGSGTSGQTRGLLNLSGVVSTTYTDASPLVGKLLSKLGSNYADMSSATAGYGSPPGTLIIHPRRAAWINSQFDTANQPVVPRYLSLVNVVNVPSVPVNLGTGTNEDRAIHVVSEAVTAYVDPPAFELFPDAPSMSAALAVKARVLTRIALVVPLSTAVGVVSGTGLAVPSFA
jgi:hypothetical protein